jgi:hypothetical protein
VLEVWATAESSQGIPEWVTFAIAAYAALLSTGVAIHQYVRGQPGVKVGFRATYVVTTKGVRDLWTIRVVNHRERPIEIRAVGLTRADKIDIYREFVDIHGDPAGVTFPFTLGDGQGKDLYVVRDDNERVKKAWARDNRDRRYLGRRPIVLPYRRIKGWWRMRKSKR